jgi:hypothetical protein
VYSSGGGGAGAAGGTASPGYVGKVILTWYQ